MANLIIQLKVNPQTKKKDVIISYTSEADALPIEHEEAHRRLVDQLIEGGALKAGEVGSIVIEREQGKGEVEEPKEEAPQPTGVKQKA
jgi:hypothetical protein